MSSTEIKLVRTRLVVLMILMLAGIMVQQSTGQQATGNQASAKALASTLLPEQGVRFPADGGVLNAIDFGANPNDSTDDTAAIQAALDKHPNGNRIVYLPAGEYLVSDTLRWADGPHAGTQQKRTILQGQGRDLTTIRVPDATPLFSGKEDSSQAVIWTGQRRDFSG